MVIDTGKAEGRRGKAKKLLVLRDRITDAHLFTGLFGQLPYEARAENVGGGNGTHLGVTLTTLGTPKSLPEHRGTDGGHPFGPSKFDRTDFSVDSWCPVLLSRFPFPPVHCRRGTGRPS